MILTVILGLAISSLCGFSAVATVIFTALFSLSVLSLFVWCKLKLGLDEEEVRAIRSYIKRAKDAKNKAGRFFAPIRRGAAKLRPILERL